MMIHRPLHCFLSFICLLFGIHGFAQTQPIGSYKEPAALSSQQLYSLSTLPPLIVPEKYRGPDAPLLPFWIDNSTQPYFRPITTQSGFECGQSAGIAFTFTYEVDRLRNLPANVASNQYPTHFTFDFLNEGENFYGVSCFDSWEIVRACGNMNVVDYGGSLNAGGYRRWITGYDKYYNGMQNRINYMRSIRCDSPEGLKTLKYWLTDHLEGSAVGGVAILYGKYFHPDIVLPEGTPEGGKYVEVHWGPVATHTFTVVGYNDSIRYDYNGDGKYTNNIDINNDGLVNMSDWEIGALKLASGYDGTEWSNEGFVYTMYKCLADNIGFGGIWNHSVYVIDTKQTYTPQLTAKIVLKHNSRNKVKVTMGISTDLQAIEPSYVVEYPVFNFEGGDHYMQGDTTEEAKTIEFGLDLAPLVSHLENGQNAQFFLQVEEKDPLGTADGQIISYSLMDYTTNPVTVISCPFTNVSIANNAVTRLKVNHSITVLRPVITDPSLPSAKLSQPWSYQLSAVSGSPPYRWDANLDYNDTTENNTYEAFQGQKLQLTDNYSGYSIITLPFSFPFFQRSVQKIYVYEDGFIVFDDQPFSWPFLIDKMLLFKYTPIIAPFLCDMMLYESQSDGIWYRADSNSVTIRWQTSIYSMQGNSGLDFTARLYRDGKIEFLYGEMNFPGDESWIGGISAGDNLNYKFSQYNDLPAVPANKLERFSSGSFPEGMKISEDGLFSGSPVFPCQDMPVTFRVTDNNNISSTKTLLFSATGLTASLTVHSVHDSVIEYGDTASVDLTVANKGNQVVHNVTSRLVPASPYIFVTDSIATFGDLGAGETITIPGAFSFKVSPFAPDNVMLFFTLKIRSDENNFQQDEKFVVHSPKIIIEGITLSDGDNGKPDPGESADMIITYKNIGGAGSLNTTVSLSSIDTCLLIAGQTDTLGTMIPGSVKKALFKISTKSNAPFDHLYQWENRIAADGGYAVKDTGSLYSGEIIEDFESGGFHKFDWLLGSNGLFTIDTIEEKQGRYCAKSGWLQLGGQSSVLSLNTRILRDGKISFYMKLSCEHDPGGYCTYDYMAFYIDDCEMGRWDGGIDWTQKSFDVTRGYHTFRWIYSKDLSISWGSDCVWLDYITFPEMNRALPVVSAAPSFITTAIPKDSVVIDTLFVTNTGSGLLEFFANVFDTSAPQRNITLANVRDGSMLSCLPDRFIPGQQFTWELSLVNQAGVNINISGVRIDLPEGIKITGATDFTGGSLGNLVYNEITGNNPALSWRGYTPFGTGVIRPGETATAVVSGSADSLCTDDLFLVWMVHSDSTGSDPNDHSGYIILSNSGLPNAWLNLESKVGKLLAWQTDTLLLTMDSRGMDTGIHTCRIVLNDGFNNKLTVPVIMHVLDTNNNVVPNIEGALLIKSYPNPFSNSVRIDYEIIDTTPVNAWIYDIRGKKIKTLVSGTLPSGRYQIFWNGENESGEKVAAGIYYCSMQTRDRTGTLKLILVK